MTAGVRTTRQADAQAERIAEWWHEHRGAAQTLFADELSGTLELLADAPDLGRRYRGIRVPGLRRLLLPRSRYHLYYVHDAQAGEVVVLALRSAGRGLGPSLHPVA